MSLVQLLEPELDRQALLGSGKVQLSCGDETLLLELDQVDALSVALRVFTFSTSRLEPLLTPQLTAVADQLAQQLTYLLEPLRVVEIDGAAGAVQMRSNVPQRKAQRRCYYEVLVTRGGITLVRYEKTPGEPRAVVPALLTREVLLRLTGDIASAVP
jgi:hypothetical protein